MLSPDAMMVPTRATAVLEVDSVATELRSGSCAGSIGRFDVR
jgi:hypothetical protein